MTSVNVPNFTIPFEVAGSTSAIREVELLVSKDRGRSWRLADRQTIETGRFAFRADTDGEYWFVFRTVTATGTPNPVSGPPRRVLVDTGNPMVAPTPQPSETQPVVPPRPERFRSENALPKPQQSASTEVPKTNEPAVAPEPLETPTTNPERTSVERPQVLAPRFPGFDPSAPEHNRDGDLMDDLLSGMSPFLDVQPVAAKNVPGTHVATDISNVSLPQFPADTPAGSITGIDLDLKVRPRIIVNWNTGTEQQWSGAQIDVLRYSVQDEGWFPIAINLPNTGIYWWYLSPEDLKPFYVAIRIRSPHSGNNVDITQKKIEINPQLAVFQSQRP